MMMTLGSESTMGSHHPLGGSIVTVCFEKITFRLGAKLPPNCDCSQLLEF